MNDVPDLLAGVAGQAALVQRPAELMQPFQALSASRRLFGRKVLRELPASPQMVQHRPVFGLVDPSTGEQLLPPGRQARSLGEFEQG
jgi:hypothetical protein